MSKLQKIPTQEKVNQVVNEQLPGFAKLFFREKRDYMSIDSLYGYALDIRSFFSYIGQIKGIRTKDISMKDFDNVSEADIEYYLSDLKEYKSDGEIKQRSTATICRRYAVLKAFYTFYYTEGLISSIPIIKVIRPEGKKKAIRTTTPDKNAQLLDFIANGSLSSSRAAAYQERCRKRDTAIVMLLICAGVKASECVNLDIQDVNLANCTLFIKTRHIPLVTLTNNVVVALSEYLKERIGILTEYGHDDALFLSLQRSRIDHDTICTMVKKYSSDLFGKDDFMVPTDLNYSFRDTIFKYSKNTGQTASASGLDLNTIMRFYAADIKDIPPSPPLLLKTYNI